MNKAYSTLLNPIERATYMLALKGVDYERQARLDGNAADKAEVQRILMEVMELNEFVDEIAEPRQVEELEARLDKVIGPLEEQIGKAFAAGDLAGAVRILAKMRYYQNISERLAELKFRFHLQGFND